MTALPGGPPPTVLVIDDHEVLSSALVAVFLRGGFQARRAPMGDASTILGAAGEAVRPAVALLDLDLGRGPRGERRRGLDLVAPLSALRWQVVAVSGSAQEQEIASAVEAGAVGFVHKARPLEQLLDVVAAVSSGQHLMAPDERLRWVTMARAARRDRSIRGELLARLTVRERQVLDRLADGSRAASIAEEFVTSLTTVRSQIRAILRKLEVSSQLEAVALVRDTEADEAPR